MAHMRRPHARHKDARNPDFWKPPCPGSMFMSSLGPLVLDGQFNYKNLHGGAWDSLGNCWCPSLHTGLLTV